MVQLSHPYTTTGKTIALIIQTFVWKIMSLLFNTLSRLVITFLPRSKCLLISLLQSPSAECQPLFPLFPIYLPWSDGTGCHDLRFLNVEPLSQLFHSPLSLSSRGSLVLLCFLPRRKGGVICISNVIDISPSNLDSSLCFFQPSISHGILCTEVK